MIRIISSFNRREVVSVFSRGGSFPSVQGRLISLELSGKELALFIERKQVPLHAASGSITWNGRFVGRALKELRELLDA
jgi:hypothetical protein